MTQTRFVGSLFLSAVLPQHDNASQILVLTFDTPSLLLSNPNSTAGYGKEQAA